MTQVEPDADGAARDQADVDDDAEAGAPRRLGPAVAAAIVVVVVVGFLVVVLATREPAANRIAESPLVGQTAPALVGTTLDGEQFDLTERRGEWVLVNFFATWCVPCQQEHDDLLAFAERHAEIGDASVVSVVFDDTTSNAREFFDRFGAAFPVVVGDDGGIALDYGVVKVPESYLVAPDGTVVAKIIGGITAEGLDEILARFEDVS